MRLWDWKEGTCHFERQPPASEWITVDESDEEDGPYQQPPEIEAMVALDQWLHPDSGKSF